MQDLTLGALTSSTRGHCSGYPVCVHYMHVSSEDLKYVLSAAMPFFIDFSPLRINEGDQGKKLL